MALSGGSCPDCGQGEIVEYVVRETGRRFWLCEECDSVWLPGEDRSQPARMALRHLLPGVGNPWKLIAPAGPEPSLPPAEAALLELCRDGKMSGLFLGMAEGGALLVVDPERTSDTTDFGDVSLRFAADKLVELTARPHKGGIDLPGIMALSSAPRLASVSRADAMRVLLNAGLEEVSDPKAKDLAGFKNGDLSSALRFESGRLTEVTVSLRQAKPSR